MFSILLSLAIASLSKNQCCLDHPKRKSSLISTMNYDCNQLTPYGKDNCQSVLGGSVCKWGKCPILGPCSRIPNYELHFSKKIDVGKCSGLCKYNLDTKNSLICAPSEYEYLELKGGQQPNLILELSWTMFKLREISIFFSLNFS